MIEFIEYKNCEFVNKMEKYLIPEIILIILKYLNYSKNRIELRKIIHCKDLRELDYYIYISSIEVKYKTKILIKLNQIDIYISKKTKEFVPELFNNKNYYKSYNIIYDNIEMCYCINCEYIICNKCRCSCIICGKNLCIDCLYRNYITGSYWADTCEDCY